jgi:hypothetical protein
MERSGTFNWASRPQINPWVFRRQQPVDLILNVHAKPEPR